VSGKSRREGSGRRKAEDSPYGSSFGPSTHLLESTHPNEPHKKDMTVAAKGFGEEVGRLILSRTVPKRSRFVVNSPLDVIILNVDMLGARMIGVGVAKVYGGMVVDADVHGILNSHDVVEDFSVPVRFLHSVTSSDHFSFHRRQGNRAFLLLGSPIDETAVEHRNEAGDGDTVGFLGPVGVAEDEE